VDSDLRNAVISFIILGVIGVVLLAGAGTGAITLPTGFGLFNQEDWTVRIITLAVLVVLGFLLYRVYVGARKS
jgi:hypothetical protein